MYSSSTSLNSYVPYTYRTRSYRDGYNDDCGQGVGGACGGFTSSSRYRRETSSTSRLLPQLPPHPSKLMTPGYSSGSSSNIRRSVSVAPSATLSSPPSYYSSYRKALSPVRSMIRDSFSDDGGGGGGGRSPRYHHRPSITSHSSSSGGRFARNTASAPRTTTRDELIDSIVHTRTRENRVMPGYLNSTDWEDRRHSGVNVDCDKVFPGIILGNGETVKNLEYLQNIGVTHVLNTAERHVTVNPAKYPLHGISYYGFHVDDHPTANISKYFSRCSDYIAEALGGGGTIVVNCVMGWSRSATVVAAFLINKKGMKSSEALEMMRQSRPIRPNPGFLQQLADHENLLNKKPIW